MPIGMQKRSSARDLEVQSGGESESKFSDDVRALILSI